MTPKATGKWLGPLVWMIVLAIVLVLIGMLPTAWEVRAHGLTLSQSHHLSQAQARSAIVAEAKREHLSSRDTSALLSIASAESHFHCWSVNHRGGCYGLFQLSAGMALHLPWFDPAWNTRRAIRYCKGRYGSPSKALAFRKRHGWY